MKKRRNWFAVVLLAMTVGGNLSLAAEQTPPGFHGQPVEVTEVACSQPSDVSIAATTVGDMDLTTMAAQAMNALKKNPRPHLDYECRFSMSLLNCPPAPGPRRRSVEGLDRRIL